jgi:hypothetical protein
MKVDLPKAYRTSLLQAPLSTPTLITLENPIETALALRVADLFSFRRQGLPISARPFGYHGKEGVWVAAVVFRVVRALVAPLEGAVYLNPRQGIDLQLLEHLAKQERLPFCFLSPHLKVTVRRDAPWSVYHRQEVRTLLAQIGHSHPHNRLAEGEDLDFERARKEFASLYPEETLLSTRFQGDRRVSSFFRGVVLD